MRNIAAANLLYLASTILPALFTHLTVGEESTVGGESTNYLVEEAYCRLSRYLANISSGFCLLMLLAVHLSTLSSLLSPFHPTLSSLLSPLPRLLLSGILWVWYIGAVELVAVLKTGAVSLKGRGGGLFWVPLRGCSVMGLGYPLLPLVTHCASTAWMLCETRGRGTKRGGGTERGGGTVCGAGTVCGVLYFLSVNWYLLTVYYG